MKVFAWNQNVLTILL